MKLKNLLPVIVLLSICIVAAGLLGAVNALTHPEILRREEQKANEALLEVLPDGSNFSKLTLTEEYPDSVTDGWKADGGYVFRMSVTGKSSGMVVMCGVSEDGKIVATKVISNQETPSYASPVFEKTEDGQAYKDATLNTLEEVIVAGSTLTSRAYANAVKAALQSYVLATGGSVDTRTPEQILNDNLNAALGTEGKKFDKWFKVASLEGIDAAYSTDSGYVFVIGESFVGIDSTGAVVSADATEENKSAALAAYTEIKSVTLDKITELPEGLGKRFVEASVSSDGVYVITVQGAGYGINGEWHASGEYMTVKVAISADGKILDTAVVYHSETEDVGGAALNNPDFIGQFVGKDSTNYRDVTVVTGATLTSDGYKNAVKNAFAAYEILKGDIE